jgi:hypothetical protein
MGNDNFRGRVGGRVVVKKEPVVFEAKIPLSLVVHFSQACQNFTVKVRVDRNVGRNKFTANNLLHAEIQ